MKIIRRIGWLAVAFTYLLISLGGTVRVNNAGLSCPDWPLCYGKVFTMPDIGALLEEVHRYTASIVSVLVIALAIGALLWARREKQILIPALVAPVFLAIQIVLGALTVLWKLPATIITAHLGTALVIFALVITVAIMAGTSKPNTEHPDKTRKFVRLAMTNALLVYGLMLSGSYVVGTGASLACPGWPLCGAAPDWAVRFHLSDINMLHRTVATIVGLVLVWTLISAWRRRAVAPGQAWVAVAAGVLFVAQASVGALVVLWNKPTFIAGLHLALATAVWGSLVILAVLAARQLRATPKTAETEQSQEESPIAEQEPQKEVGRVRQTISSYIDLMKPHVTVLLLGTTVAAMAIAYQGLPPLLLTVATLLGGAMAAGSANCINCYIDRDIDQIMGRTQRRSLPAGKVQPTHALIFGIILGIGSFIILDAFVNLLSAVLAFSAILFYVFVYTLGLKRTSAQNIVIGGAAGAVPVLVGWAAVTNTITLPAIWLFAIIFYWTPPHFWALSLLIQKDYEKARVPMLPVVMGERETRKQILLYSLLLLAVTMMLFVIHTMGYIYLASALILGGILIYMAIRLMIDQTKSWARTLFWYSNCYLAAIFAVMVVDRVVHVSIP
ncbi:MAG TPA: heme o synthase [Ktedonosporobacter sp.]|jgi:protoheme IX farnesyltransferase|nr:heme o synthase [Ktedonosporobacter sp.]